MKTQKTSSRRRGKKKSALQKTYRGLTVFRGVSNACTRSVEDHMYMLIPHTRIDQILSTKYLPEHIDRPTRFLNGSPWQTFYVFLRDPNYLHQTLEKFERIQSVRDGHFIIDDQIQRDDDPPLDKLVHPFRDLVNNRWVFELTPQEYTLRYWSDTGCVLEDPIQCLGRNSTFFDFPTFDGQMYFQFLNPRDRRLQDELHGSEWRDDYERLGYYRRKKKKPRRSRDRRVWDDEDNKPRQQRPYAYLDKYSRRHDDERRRRRRNDDDGEGDRKPIFREPVVVREERVDIRTTLTALENIDMRAVSDDEIHDALDGLEQLDVRGRQERFAEWYLRKEEDERRRTGRRVAPTGRGWSSGYTTPPSDSETNSREQKVDLDAEDRDWREAQRDRRLDIRLRRSGDIGRRVREGGMTTRLVRKDLTDVEETERFLRRKPLSDRTTVYDMFKHKYPEYVRRRRLRDSREVTEMMIDREQERGRLMRNRKMEDVQLIECEYCGMMIPSAQVREHNRNEHMDEMM